MKVIDSLSQAIRAAATFNPDVQAAPACILWPDKDRQWQAAMPRLQAAMPELCMLGEYAPEQRTGPAIWLRCALAGKAPDVALPGDKVPVCYLPGVSRQDLRAVEECPEHLKPLAELQYRGVIWSQVNAKDWTLRAFLRSDQGGLGLDVAGDGASRNAMQLALTALLDEELELLRGKRLDQDYFNTLLTGGDPVRDLLQWLDQGDAFHSARDAAAWQAFVQVCRSQTGFDPETEGVLAAASQLAQREGPWLAVWERFCEAPARYPNIPTRIRQCTPPDFDLFANADSAGGWPQWNEAQEHALQHELLALRDQAEHAARTTLRTLATAHAARRELVWAELGESPLAQAMQHLGVLAEVTQTSLAAGTVDDLKAGYSQHGWRADDAVLSALACVDQQAHMEAVTVAIRATYLPWAEASARHLQKLTEASSYPGGGIAEAPAFYALPSQCVLFVDGLRLDTARRLKTRLEASRCEVHESMRWSALPSVTATGKAAVSPVRALLAGSDDNEDFEPCVAETGKSLRGGYHFKKLLQTNQWQILARDDHGDGEGHAWCEFGNIDKAGHDRGWKLAKHLDALLAEVAERIVSLLDARWASVTVVTDHGWLLMPGGLPTIRLSKDLAATKWGRCAALKPGAAVTEHLYPWFWNPHQQFALADGIACYGKSVDYNHGGLSLQECLNLELKVTRSQTPASTPPARLSDIVWQGMRCKVAAEGSVTGLRLDIRTQPADATSSVTLAVKAMKDQGVTSVVVEDEDLQGSEAFVVLLATSGELVAQHSTIIGTEG